MKDAYFRANAAAVIMDTSGKILLLRRKDTGDTWQFPQGGIVCNETPQQAVIREVWEETGIAKSRLCVKAEILDWMVYAVPNRWATERERWGQAQKWFLIEVPSGTIPKPDNKEFDAFMWTDSQRFFPYVNALRSNTYRKVLKILLPQTVFR